jgi:hypothetical protein
MEMELNRSRLVSDRVEEPLVDSDRPPPPAKKKAPKSKPIEDMGTIFHQDWMMDAASQSRWDKIEIQWDNKLVASLSYVVDRRFGMKTVAMPYYTHVLGPILHLPPAKPSRILENSTKLIGQLLTKLPAHDRFYQTLAPEYALTTAFVLSGMKVDSRLTFRLAPDLTPESVMASMKGAQRRNIATTFDTLTCRQHSDLDKFHALARIQTQGEVSRYRFDLIEAMFQAALSRDQATILSLYNDADQNMATTVLLYDERVAYLWLTTRDTSPGNRAYARIIWEAYKFAQERGLIFDFDGYPSIAGAQYLSNFGGTPIIRNAVLTTNLRFDAMAIGQRFVKRLVPPQVAPKAGATLFL